MNSIEQPLILREDDYQILVSFLKDGRYARREDARFVTDLELEIRKATLVTKDQFPRDVVRLNSRIRIIDSDRDSSMDLILVTGQGGYKRAEDLSPCTYWNGASWIKKRYDHQMGSAGRKEGIYCYGGNQLKFDPCMLI